MTDPEDSTSTSGRLWCAFILAPIVAGLLGSTVIAATLTGDTSLWAGDIEPILVLSLFAVPIAFAHMLLLGLPLYLLLSIWWRVSWWSAAVGGFVVGAVPCALMFGNPSTAVGPDMWEIARLAGYAGGYGAVSGLVFYAVLALGERTKRRGGPLPDRPFDLPEPEA